MTFVNPTLKEDLILLDSVIGDIETELKQHEKICSKCKKAKLLSEFADYKSGKNKGKFLSHCKVCCIEHRKNHAAENAGRAKNWSKNNIEKSRNSCKIWRAKNKKSIKAYTNTYRKNKFETDPLYRCRQSIRSLIKVAIKGKGCQKLCKTELILGCSFKEFQEHIEKQFKPGMTWLNHGIDTWHIDHIIPMASAKTEAEVLKLNHYTNLQPLEADKNLSKGSKLIYNTNTVNTG